VTAIRIRFTASGWYCKLTPATRPLEPIGVDERVGHSLCLGGPPCRRSPGRALVKMWTHASIRTAPSC
jgi:hypothetical protein